MFLPLLNYRLLVLAVVSICVLFHACSSSSDAQDMISSAALPVSEPQAFPPDSVPPSQSQEEVPSQDGEELTEATYIANGSENAPCLADYKCNEDLICINEICVKGSDPVQFLPNPQDIQPHFRCGTYLSFDVPPSSPLIPLVSLLDKVLRISEANASPGPLSPSNVRDFTPEEIQKLIETPLTESFLNLGTEIYNPPKNGFGPGEALAKRAADIIIETKVYLNHLEEWDKSSGYPKLIWGIVKDEKGRNISMYDLGSNTIIIDPGLEKKYSMAYIASVVVHEFTHWKDIFQLGPISIAQTEANSYLVGGLAYHFTKEKTKEMPLGQPATESVQEIFSETPFIVGNLRARPPLAQYIAFFLDPRFQDDMNSLGVADYRSVESLIYKAFEKGSDVGDYVWDHVRGRIEKLKRWAYKHGGSIPAHRSNSSSYKILTGTSGSRSGWPIPSHGEPVVGKPQDVNAAVIEVFHIPNGFSIEVQGVKWPDYSAQFSLGSQLFLKDEKSGKYVGNLWGVFDYLPEAGLYLLKGKMFDQDPNRPFDPNEKPPDPKKYILPLSPFDLKQPNCGEDGDGNRNPLDYDCFKSCQKEIKHVNERTKSGIWEGCVEWGLPLECGASSRTFCWSHLGVPASATCNASEPSCINTDYYREGPVTNLGEVPAYGTVAIDASSKKITLYFNASGGLNGYSTGAGEVYTLKSDGTWEGDLGGKIPLGDDGKSQEIPPTGIALWNPDPNDPNKFTIQYGPAITALLSEDHPLPGYTDPKDDPKCDMPAYGPGSFACERSADHPNPSCCWCNCGSCAENGESVECGWED